MGKRLLTDEDARMIEKKVKALKSYPTWTKDKHLLKKDIFLYIKRNFKTDIHWSYADFQTSKKSRFYTWDYEIKVIPKDQRGYFKIYRGRKLFILCISIFHYGTRELLILPYKIQSSNSKA